MTSAFSGSLIKIVKEIAPRVSFKNNKIEQNWIKNKYYTNLVTLFLLFLFYQIIDQSDQQSPSKKQKVHHSNIEIDDEAEDDDDEGSFDIIETDNETDGEEDFEEDEAEDILEDFKEQTSKASTSMSHSIHAIGKKKASVGAVVKDSGGIEDLASFMKKMDIASHRSSSHGRRVTKKELFPSSKSFVCYTWKDQDLNKLITLEILLSCSGEECTVELEEVGGGKQVLVLSQPLPWSWLNMEFYRENVMKSKQHGQHLNEKQIYNHLQRLASRAECMKAVSNNFGENTREDHVITKQYFELPFRCDDVNVEGGYPGTGIDEDVWPVLGRKMMVLRGNQYVEEYEELGDVNVLTITLVAEEKYQKRNDKTPRRRKKLAAAYSSYGNDEGRVFVNANSNPSSFGAARGNVNAGVSAAGVPSGVGGFGNNIGNAGNGGVSATSNNRRRGRSHSAVRNGSRMRTSINTAGVSMEDDEDGMSFDGDSYHFSTPRGADQNNSGIGFDVDGGDEDEL